MLRKLLLMSYDIITPRQQPCKHLHISPSPCQWHVIGWRHWLCCSTCDLTQTRNRPGPVSVDYDLGPVDFDFLRWPLTKSQNFQHGLSSSVFRVDFNFGFCFFIWNSEIRQLAHSSLWFLQRHYSRHLQMISHAYPTSSLHWVSALSLREDVRDIY